MPHAREEQDVAEQHREEPHRVQHRRRVGDAERAGPEEVRSSTGSGWCARPPQERDAQDDRAGEAPEHPRARPAPGRALGDGRARACRGRRRRAGRRGSPVPPGSRREAWLGSTARPASQATSPIGRLTKNAQRQPPAVTRRRRATGPWPRRARRRRPTAPRPVIAARRGNAASSSPSDAGSIAAAPQPWMTRPGDRAGHRRREAAQRRRRRRRPPSPAKNTRRRRAGRPCDRR